MSKARVQKWDILKFLLIFLVVLGHVCDFHTAKSETARSIYIFIYTFHMPVFIFISGLFSKRMIHEKRYDKISSYLILYLLIKLVNWSYFAIFHHKYEFSLFSENGVAWFMFALFVFSLLTILVKNVRPQYFLAVWIILACIAGYDPSIGKFLVISRIIVYYPFYYLGYCLNIEDAVKLTKLSVRKRILCLLYLLFLAGFIFFMGDSVYFIRPLLTGCNPFASLGTLMPYGFILRFLCYVLQFITGFAVIALIPANLKADKFAQLGQYTLSVYVFHYLILYFLYYMCHIDNLYKKILPSSPTVMIIPLAVIITFILSNKTLANLLGRVSTVQIERRS